jgi:hypothetical protein
MRKLGCFGAVAAALLMSAGTAHADPFTVTSNTPSTRGIDNAWFNNLIKLNGPPSATTKTYVANSIIIFGGDLVAVPNASITIMSGGRVVGGFDGILFSGAVDTLGWMNGKHGSAAAKHTGNSTSVPGANGAYDPFTPVYAGLGAAVPHGPSANDPGAALLLFVPGLSIIPISAILSHADPAATAALARLGNAAVSSLPATPEPSAFLLLAGGLALAVVMKRYNLGLSRG